ncbi:hypothetical protein ASPWEDRAFT_116085 [Aspergillus wentii DTO 134E9]|uniref:Enoyl reductase (ER) domain-containing protein n=1 Tax=Aspergillus wentii DTO 134E9 TaxID=1073089 RepID=A0A1L9RCU2_ASPWE|nr:uncharacterized protein ASPWEDRAFT_116085 [Aspergillus wentii DTO 134E9]OJJ32708.1 hypothetical protein ASPWEDRAFT_116085 [Aspergillus wentii DTO 134E9]
MVQAIQFRGSPSGEIIQETNTLPDVKPDEVLIQVTHSGLCGSDLHMLKLPLVLGHEGIGIVEQVGSACTRLNVGDRVGWGPIYSTCGDCEMCVTGRDTYCHEVKVYGSAEWEAHGSFCSHVIRKVRWTFNVPDRLSSAEAAPLMCGGATVWAPLVEQCKSFERVGIVGIGGLGHLAIEFASKMGCDVVVFSSSPDKKEEALSLGASEFYATKGLTDYADLNITKPINRLIITSSTTFDLGLFCAILAPTATIHPLTLGPGDLAIPNLSVLFGGYRIVGSLICTRCQKNQMLDFAARHNISCIVETFPMTLDGVNEAVNRLKDGKMRYRGVVSWEY